MPNCQAETIAVGGMGSGRAPDACCSAKAMATATAAARAFCSSLRSIPVGPSVGDGLGVTDVSSAESEVSAMKLVSAAIIHHNKMIAAKTSPMPRAVIWSATDMLLIQECSH